MAALKESTKNIFLYVKEHQDENITSEDVAKALGMAKRSVDGSFTSFCREDKGWGYRDEQEITLADDSRKKVKYLRLTELGMTIDPDNPPSPKKD